MTRYPPTSTRIVECPIQVTFVGLSSIDPSARDLRQGSDRRLDRLSPGRAEFPALHPCEPALEQVVHRGGADDRAVGHREHRRMQDERHRLLAPEAAVEADQ